MKVRINLADAIDDLAPKTPPPCFHNRMDWIEYLKSCAAVQNQKGEPKIIVIENGEPSINYNFPYCEDCTQVKSHQMHTASKCQPDFLKELGKKANEQ